MEIKIFNNKDNFNVAGKNEIVNFLYINLGQYTDSKKDIEKALDYALYDNSSLGGLVFIAYENEKIIGIAVVNRTGMKGYIPENILVYITVHTDYRREGIGKELMKKIIKNTDGNIALHVEPENPARFLYNKMKFEKKYIEMRLTKETI